LTGVLARDAPAVVIYGNLKMNQELGILVLVCSALLCACVPDDASGTESNLVYNGSFELGSDADGRPNGWRTSGHREIKQAFQLAAGRETGHSANLVCGAFTEGTPGSHVMACQTGRMAVKKGQWYRLSFWSRGNRIDRHICQARLLDMRTWKSSGIAVSFAATPVWRHTEKFYRSAIDIPASDSRLQFWFNSTGSLWLDDIQLEPIEMEIRYLPEILPGNTRNLLYNGSFECGLAGWGSYTPELHAWPGNLFRPLCSIDATTSFLGTQSLRIEANSPEAPIFQWDYRGATPERIATPFAAHHGWAKVRPGEPCTFSCYVKASRRRAGVAIRVRQSEGRSLYQYVNAGTAWQRLSFHFIPESSHVWLAIGPKPGKARDGEPTTLWIDGAQLEFGTRPSPFTCRSDIEVGLSTTEPGNIFFDPADGIELSIDFSNASSKPLTVRGDVTAVDFFDQEVVRRHVEQELPPHGRTQQRLGGILAGQQGYYRFRWQRDDRNPTSTPSLRAALLAPYPHANSVFGMNHPYPWRFLLPLCKSAGLTWMRDWSVAWDTVEPKQGKWNFQNCDTQIARIQEAKLNTLMLLPFPAASWSSSATVEKEETRAEESTSIAKRARAHASRIPGSFQNYVKESVRHYGNRIDHFAILNEPVYTMYALPERYGYGTEDYLNHLETAYRAIKAEQPTAQVIGGIGAWLDRHWVHEFIKGGGLQWCDAMDAHLYPATVPPNLFEADLKRCHDLMRKHGGIKPIWLTEFGCYADDDPHMTPIPTIGDSAMSRANWPNERAASEALVKTAAVFLSNGIEKIFYHAGTCGVINEKCGGSVFFEYGGTPRKMYAAQTVLAHMLGPKPQPVPITTGDQLLKAYAFRTGDRFVAIVWSTDGQNFPLPLTSGVSASNIMGNSETTEPLSVSGTPIYLVAGNVEALARSVGPVE
jgi:hypothetical protein